MDRISERIKSVIAEKPNAVIGIDGCCASGKTTLAERLAKEFDVQIIHMDDFFLPPEMRTESRLSQTGGNVHYERFNDEVVSGLINGSETAYRVFSCKCGDFTETKTVSPFRPVIIEGSYAFHPEIRIRYDLKIFVKTDCETQLERILKRNGREALEVFKSKWIPLENRYFDEFRIEQNCDIIKQTEK